MAVKRPKANTKRKNAPIVTVVPSSYPNIITTNPKTGKTSISKSQLFDPFYGQMTSKYAKSNPDMLLQSVDIYDVRNAYLREKKKNKVKNHHQREVCFITDGKTLDQLMRSRAYEFAYFEFKKQIEESPSGSNTGPGITTTIGDYEKCYIQAGKASSGDPWCACFVSWCYYMAGWTSLPLSGSLADASAWGNAIKEGRHIRAINPENAVAGDTVVFNLNSGSNNDHVGIFSRWLLKPSENGGVGLFTSIEGNTTPDSVVLVDGKNLTYSTGGDGGEGVYGKKHIYQASTGSDPIKGKTINFSRIYS